MESDSIDMDVDVNLTEHIHAHINTPLRDVENIYKHIRQNQSTRSRIEIDTALELDAVKKENHILAQRLAQFADTAQRVGEYEVTIGELKGKITRMKEKRKEKEHQYQKDFDDLQTAANLLEVKEEEFKQKVQRIESEKNEMEKRLLTIEASESQKTKELIAIVKEYHEFKQYVSMHTVAAEEMDALEGRIRQETVPLSEFHGLVETLNTLRTQCRLNLVSKEEYDALQSDYDTANRNKSTCEDNLELSEKEKKYTNDRLVESHAREDALKGEISMLNATIVKLRNENSKMYAEMEDLKAVTINGGPIGDQLRHELNELREKMRIEVSSHEALRHRLVGTEAALNHSQNIEKELLQQLQTSIEKCKGLEETIESSPWKAIKRSPARKKDFVINTSSPVNVSKVSKRSISKSTGKSSKIGHKHAKEPKTPASFAREMLASFSRIRDDSKENNIINTNKIGGKKMRSKTGSKSYL